MGTTLDFINALVQAIWGFLNHQLLPIGAALAVLMIIWGGILYTQNRGEEGKKAIETAIIGLIIVALAKVIIDVIISLF